MKLLSTNSKMKKLPGAAKRWLPAILHLAPERVSGHNVCPMASKGCKESCLNTAGMGIFSNVQAARIAKTRYLFNQRGRFLHQLDKEIKAHAKKARGQGLKPCIRLNGTSDIAWEVLKIEGKNLFERNPDVQFWDYTKIPKRMAHKWRNYHLVFSRSEENDKEAWQLLDKGFQVAMVFDKSPKEFAGIKTVDGDKHDLRFLDKGLLIALSAKGKAKKDTTGFVLRGY
jgi:hypothetical protein